MLQTLILNTFYQINQIIFLIFKQQQASSFLIANFRYVDIFNKRQTMINKVLIYIFTFAPHMAINMMRTCYSFNKHNIQNYFGVGDLFIAMLDASIFLSLAVGSFLKFSLSNSLKPVQTCLWTSIISAIAYAMIATIPLVQQEGISYLPMGLIQFILIMLMIIFSFFSFSTFPCTFTIFCHTFNNKDHGSLVGIWSSRNNIGHIIGFFLSNLLVYTFHLRWQYTMLIFSGIYILVCILLFIFVKNPSQQVQTLTQQTDSKNTAKTPQQMRDNVQLQSSQQKETKISTKQFYQFVKNVWKSIDFRFYIFSLSLFKAVLYAYQFQTPKFLDAIGYGEYSGYVPSLFDAATLVGSFIMGFIYQKQLKSHSKVLIIISRYKILVSSIMTIVFTIISAVVHGNIGFYFAIGCLMGLFLGATYNFLQNTQILTYCDNNARKGDMYATFSTAVASGVVGLVQVIIGLSLNLGNDEQSSQQIIQRGYIYYAIAGVALAATLITFGRTLYQNKAAQIRNNQLQELGETSNRKSKSQQLRELEKPII